LCRALAGMGAMAMAEARDSERFIQAQQARQKRARPLPPVSRRRFLTRKPSISR
jgi:hypothetical protein